MCNSSHVINKHLPNCIQRKKHKQRKHLLHSHVLCYLFLFSIDINFIEIVDATTKQICAQLRILILVLQYFFFISYSFH